ncbi:hypothetical protein V1511DRAFT_509246 [Dipodascopsis uninucleata]
MRLVPLIRIALFSVMIIGAASAPITAQKPCFVEDMDALPAHMLSNLNNLAYIVTCDKSTQITPGVPNIMLDGISLKDYDFRTSTLKKNRLSVLQIGDLSHNTLSKFAMLYECATIAATSAKNAEYLKEILPAQLFLEFQYARLENNHDQAEDIWSAITKIVDSTGLTTKNEIVYGENVDNHFSIDETIGIDDVSDSTIGIDSVNTAHEKGSNKNGENLEAEKTVVEQRVRESQAVIQAGKSY